MSELTRRDVMRSVVAALAAGELTGGLTAAAADDKPVDKAHDMSALPPGWVGSETIGMLIYPKFTALDLFGPQHVFISMMGAKVHLIAKTAEPVPTDSGVKIVPTMTFADCPKKLSVLFVPGGADGTIAAARDKETREFVAERGAAADWVTSVCTGSLILGAAGLLQGYKATSHWMVRDMLKMFGAVPTAERVVVDRNRVTGAGVTSGFDFALSLCKQLRNEDYAKAVQLFSEYDPQPPVDCGRPEKASPETLKLLTDMFKPFRKQIDDMARELRPSP
jgi:cyclohexyl-isocyanide hydratase